MGSDRKDKISTCPICEHAILDKDIKNVRAENGFTYKICPSCGLGILFPKPSRELLKKIYSSQDYFTWLSAPVKNPIIQWFLTRRIFESPSEWVRRKFKPGKILDVGCGNGEFLADLQTHGWDVWGSDISSVAVKNSGEKIGKNQVKQGDFLKQKFTEKFDIISFWHILEHVETPILYLQKAHTLLKSNGIIIGEMPNFDSAIVRLFTTDYSWFMLPDHILYFSKKSLKKTAERAGFAELSTFFPPRSLLNFSLSFNNVLNGKKLPLLPRRLLFFSSIPFSIVLGILFAKRDKGEIIRFIAQK